MNDESGCRLRELLPQSMDGMTDELRQELDRSVGGVEGKLLCGFLGSQAIGAIDAALDVDVFELLARGWSVARELAEFADTKKHPPAETVTVTLGKHDFTTALHPELTYRIANLSSPPVRFTLELTAQIKSVKLEIRDRRLIAVGVAEGLVSSQLKYKSVPLHKTLESRSVHLAGRYALRTPIEIARAAG